MARARGLHRLGGPGEPAHLHVALVARRTSLSDAEWARLEPPSPKVANELTREPPVRGVPAGAREIEIAGGAARAAVAPDDYWPRFEEIVLEHLLLLEREAAAGRARDARALYDEGFGAVRELWAQNNRIAAIKLYRELTSVGLAEAKRAVEEMCS